MGKWQGAWYLAKHEWKQIRWKHLLTLLFVFYFVVLTVPAFTSGIEAGNGQANDWNWGLDFMSLGLLPWIGLMGIQSSSMSWRSNVFSSKIAYWRTLPITTEHISRSRVLTLTVNSVIALSVTFILSCLALSQLSADFNIGAYVQYALFMNGLSLIVGMMFLVFEAAFSHKAYSLLCFVIVFLYMTTLLVYVNLSGNSIVLYLYESAASGFWYWPIIGFAAAGLTMLAVIPLIENRIKNRDLFNV